MSVCATCPVDLGECPRCGTFWIRTFAGPAGKRLGVRRVDSNPVIASGKETTQPGWLDGLWNVVTK